MRRLQWASAVALGLAGFLIPGQASAQFYQRPQTSPFPRPTISPYLNLFRPGGNFTQNYFGITRPQLQTYNNLQQLERGETALAQQLASAQSQNATSSLPPTGQSVGFFTHTRYFMTVGRGGSGGGASAARPQSRRR